MKFVHKTLGLLLASVALVSCGGSGGNGGGFSPPQSGSITLSATTQTLPLNTAGYDPGQRGAPTQAEVTITWRNPDGSLVVGHDVQASISPITVAALSCLASGTSGGGSSSGTCTSTSDLFGSIPITGINGQATIFVNSRQTTGTAQLVVSAVDPVTNATVNQTMLFTVTSGVGPAPANVAVAPSPAGVYIPDSGGVQSSLVSATVTDGGGQLVPDPTSGNSGFDNVQFEIVNGAGGATLSANSVTGPVVGTTVTAHTTHGVATASFQSGTVQGPIQIRATADAADNNVSNGIQDPVSGTTSVVVSDGKLYSLEITSPVVAPNLPGLTLNAVSGDVTSGSSAIPPDPDATLSLVVSALGTDRQGNPVLPNTPIRFGSVDEPVGAPGTALDNDFLISGGDGNPQEGGTLFTAPTGQFTTAGGGAGPGDALVVFGKAVQGNSDLVSAVTVASINSATSLNVSSPFNRNDTTGTTVDYGSVLPYLIGRSEHGNISSPATTNDIGVVHTTLNYTVNSVGSAVAIWAQGDGTDTVTGGQRRVTDAGTLTYPGLAPATLVVTPLTIAGNTTTSVTACVTDALGISLRGVSVGFLFTFSGSGSGTVDGHSGTGVFTHKTGLNGCATGSVTTTGVSGAGGTAGTLTISAAGQSQDVNITAPITHTLTVNVNATSANVVAGSYTVGVNGSAFSPPVGSASCTAVVQASATPATQTCTYQVTEGANVAMTEGGPSQFAGWSDDCASGGTSPNTSVVVNGDVTCTATW